MKTSNVVVWLSSLIVVLALVAASIGLFWQDGGSSFTFTTIRGDTISIAGQGLYRYDTNAILTLYAIWFTVLLFRNVSERRSSQDTHLFDVV